MRLTDLRRYFRLRRFVENPWRTVRARKARPPTPDHIVHLRGGGQLVLRTGLIDRHIFREVFERDEYRLDAFRPGQLTCVVDLGANVGIFAVRAAPLAGRVIAYEPIALNFEGLCRHVGGLPSVTARREAVAGRAGTVRLYHPVDPRNPGQYSGYTEDPDRPYDEVPAVTLDGVFERHAIECCDLLKLDVEGHEYEILHAASDETFARIQRIHGEYHDRWPDDPRTRIDAFQAYLERKGFQVEIEPVRERRNYGRFFATRRS